MMYLKDKGIALIEEDYRKGIVDIWTENLIK